MKLFTTVVFTLCFLVNQNKISSAPISAPMYSASVTVYDQSGQPLAGVPIRMELHTTIAYEWDVRTTDSNGYVYIPLTAPGFLEYMYVTITNQNYEILSSQGTYTETSIYLYPTFNVGLDINRNDITDGWEMPLARKFCPKLFQEKKDSGWLWGVPGLNHTLAPLPVEAMDLNGDDILDVNDVRVQVRDFSTGNIIGDGYKMDDVYVHDQVQGGFFPYSSLYPERVKRIHAVFGQVGTSQQLYYLLPLPSKKT